jgi:carboxypeptidase family protein
VLSASAGGTTSASGLYGVVTRGPVTPVCVPERPCFRPVAGATIVLSRVGQVRRVTTDRLGRYRIAVAAGRYAVRVLLDGTARLARPTIVVVLPSRFLRVGFSIDTGIR